jgi:hypothetical protein
MWRELMLSLFSMPRSTIIMTGIGRRRKEPFVVMPTPLRSSSNCMRVEPASSKGKISFPKVTYPVRLMPGSLCLACPTHPKKMSAKTRTGKAKVAKKGHCQRLTAHAGNPAK